MSKNQLEYFKDAILFFQEVQWLYNMPVTKILCKGSLDALPSDWLEVLVEMDNDEFNDFVTELKIKRTLPESLQRFFENCKDFNKLPTSDISQCTPELPESFLKKLSIKKQHEIFHLAKLVHDQCSKQKISLIVDLGSGLGYICQLLNYLYGYQVLGLESNSQNVETARSRQKNLFPDSISSVKYVCSTIDKNSSKYVESILQSQFENPDNICLIGLHACGDLSVHMSKMYLEMEKAKLLILVSCCYHKLSLENRENNVDIDREYFNYFPISESLKSAFNIVNVDVGQIFRRPFMRLACQETSDRWQKMSEKTHDEHSFYVLARAILELYSVENDLGLKKLVRKGTRKSQCTNFNNYLEDCIQRYVYEKRSETGDSTNLLDWDDKIKTDLIHLWETNKTKKKSIEIYTALQLLLQRAVESLVLTDRIEFLKEHYVEAEIIQIMNRSLSPRSFAIISNKKCQ